MNYMNSSYDIYSLFFKVTGNSLIGWDAHCIVGLHVIIVSYMYVIIEVYILTNMY